MSVSLLSAQLAPSSPSTSSSKPALSLPADSAQGQVRDRTASRVRRFFVRAASYSDSPPSPVYQTTTTTPQHSQPIPIPATASSKKRSLSILSQRSALVRRAASLDPAASPSSSIRSIVFSSARSLRSSTAPPSPSPPSLSSLYSPLSHKVGSGAAATVRLVHRKHDPSSPVYAVKAFRPPCKGEDQQKYIQKLASEFSVASSLQHQNIVHTFDFLRDSQLFGSDRWCQVMEYCSGGDLFSIIKKAFMTPVEKNCLFKQLMRGVAYMHSQGVAHRDIKPENLLITTEGCLKIADFGTSDVIRGSYDENEKVYKLRTSKGQTGSTPYMAPEIFTQPEYNALAVDVWACALVYSCMWNGGLLWNFATSDSLAFSRFSVSMQSLSLPQDCPSTSHQDPLRKIRILSTMLPSARHIISRMLDLDPVSRITASQVLKVDWLNKRVECCQDQSQTQPGVIDVAAPGLDLSKLNIKRQHYHTAPRLTK